MPAAGGDALPIDPDIEAPGSGHPIRPSMAHAAAVFVNMIGAMLLGVLGGSLFASRPEAVTLRLFLGAGVLGGWTTYSAIVVGLLTFAHFGSWLLLSLNIVVASVLPFMAAALGLVVGNLIVRTGRS